jgi:hypothetical protein
MNFRALFFALLVSAVAVVSAAAAPELQQRQATTITVPDATAIASSIASEISENVAPLLTSVTSIGGQALTVVTGAGGAAITLAESGAGVVTSTLGSLFTIATAAAASAASSAASSAANGAYGNAASALTPQYPLQLGVALLAMLASTLFGALLVL